MNLLDDLKKTPFFCDQDIWLTVFVVSNTCKQVVSFTIILQAIYYRITLLMHTSNPHFIMILMHVLVYELGPPASLMKQKCKITYC